MLADAGKPLEPALRRDMERHFGHDFSRIRVHSDAAAEQSARNVHALAYTVGHNIVFGAGQAPTGSPAGRRLLAHELTHTIQQNGNSPTLQRQVAPAPDAKPDSSPQTPTPSDPLVDTLESAIKPALLVRIADPSQKGKPSLLVLKEQWPTIESWILTLTAAAAIKQWLPDLVAPELVDQLKALSKDARKKLAKAVFDRLVAAVDTTAPAPDVYRKEFDMLDQQVRDLIEGNLAGYVAMRNGLKRVFGSIKALNTFVRAMVKPDFPTGASVTGAQNSLVHRELKAALNKAQALLDKKKLTERVTDFLKANGGYWGANIRENRNRPAEIGNHSFGFAIDIASNTNPNLPAFPWDLVQRETGFDAYADDFVKKARFARPGDSHSGPADFNTVLESAQSAKRASDAFRDIFDTEASLKDAMLAEAHRFKGPLWITKDALFEMVATPAGKSAAAPALAQLLGKAMAHADDHETQLRQAQLGSGDAREESPVWMTIVAGLRPIVKTHANLARAMKIVQAQLDDPKDGPGKGDDASLSFLFDKTVVEQLRRSSQAARRRDLSDKIWADMLIHVRETETPVLAGQLLNLHDIFVRSHKAAGKIGSGDAVATAAAHGFMNLMPELVAALTSSEGGGLLWLGLVPRPGAKDWMHFELRDWPKIDRDSKWETDPPEVIPAPDAISGADAPATPKKDAPADGGN